MLFFTTAFAIIARKCPLQHSSGSISPGARAIPPAHLKSNLQSTYVYKVRENSDMLKLSAFLLILVITTMFLNSCSMVSASGVVIPNPKTDAPLATKKTEQMAVFAGGCFWGVEAVFDRVKGV